jgi:hypothetical protein
MSMKTRAGVALALAVGALALPGCPGTDEETPSPADDAGPDATIEKTDATPGTDAAPPPKDAAADQDAGPPPCGSNTTLCKDGEKCGGALDCVSKVCRDGICKTAAPADGVKNGDETDVDCGGKSAPACADGLACLVKDDCQSGVCTGNVCQAPSPTDGVKNGDETDVDCGGAVAPKCAVGKGCKIDGDCNNVKCDPVQKKCNPPSHTDGLKNGDETDVDCGGPTAPNKCATGQGCAANSDCNNVLCDVGNTNLCLPPSSTDGLKNGTETDVDCGGGAPTNAPGCADGKTCGADGDCLSTVCSAANKCMTGRSCKTAATSGITTCGKRETSDPTKVHESCCKSLPLPNVPGVRLDKYEVTAGRFRQFINAVGPNLRAWAQNEIANGTPTGVRLANDLTPTMVNLLPASRNPTEPLNLLMQIGNTVMDSRVPSMSQGCYNDASAYGANTFYWDNATRASLGLPPRRFTQAQYDEKSMNCGAYWMYAAFCAWDGGRMPTTAEMNDAWGATNYPWGTATYTFPTNPGGGAYQYEQTANYYNNSVFFYHYPDYGNGADLAGYIAAPGRFILDATANKFAGESWMDLGANVMELTHYGTGNNRFCDFSVTNGPGDVPDLTLCNDGGVAGVVRATGLPNVVWVGGSWEGHRAFSFNPAAEPWFTRSSYNLPAQTQYGKTGLRCARDY